MRKFEFISTFQAIEDFMKCYEPKLPKRATKESAGEGEYKIEPLVKDNKLYYYQCILNITSPVSIDEVFSIGNNELDICTNNIEMFMKSE